ncbi:MAG: NAD(P)H-hydrate dehydratase [Thermodesulfobacteria bacterium]|nr:NAD(P)H-hydrate dehydratase [Thermodesulfobacteriota bacterium]
MLVLTSQEMQELDSLVIKGLGISGEVLMERAGLGVVQTIEENFPADRFKKVLIVCGPGNNGGDGFVCARHLWDLGYSVKCAVLAKEDKYKGEAKTNFELVKKLGIEYFTVNTFGEFKEVIKNFFPDLVVDAIFGTGLKREVGGIFGEVVKWINEDFRSAGGKVIAVDIPTGVCASTGRVLGVAVKADFTVTFEYPKLGHYFYPGKEFCGELKVVKISFPLRYVEEFAPKRFFLDESYGKKVLKKRCGYVHKGTFGHVAVLAGSRGKSGAGFLTALGALKSGAGLVTLISTETLQKIYCSMLPEALTVGLKENEYGEIALSEADRLCEELNKRSVVVIGPGLGLSEEMKELVKKVLLEVEKPFVIDADALTLVAKMPEVLKDGCKVGAVLTPHPGEAIRLLNKSKEEVMGDRLNATKLLASFLGKGCALLKGPHTVVVSTDGREGISSIDEPGLAQGGNGDVLAGIIGSLIAQKYDLFEATTIGVLIHGLAGKLLAKTRGDFGFTAKEVAEALPLVIKELLNEEKYYR